MAIGPILLLLALPPTPVPTVRVPDVAYGGTPPVVIRAMLELAGTRKDDVVFDLGCGDGRIVLEAAKRYGARGVGVDVDARLIRKARDSARKAALDGRVTFREEDLFTTDLAGATVVAIFLGPTVNLRLKPRLLAELPPGTRVVSHFWDMGAWTPDREVRLTVNGEVHPVYLWTVPARQGGN